MDFVEKMLEDEQERRRNPPIHGVLTAKVTGRMDDGSFELSYLGMGQNAPSAPARVLMPTAGNKRGMFAMPDVGDEVVVAFDSGDSNMPIIMGALYNSESPAPDQASPSAENNIRTFVSRSGHELTFDDTSAQGKVKVKTAGGAELVLDDTAPGKIKLTSISGIAIEMDDATQTLKLTAPLKIEIESAAVLIKTAQLSMGPGGSGPPQPTEITAPMGITIDGGISAKLKGLKLDLETTGVPAASMVSIDNKPYILHTHGVPPTTGPVTVP